MRAFQNLSGSYTLVISLKLTCANPLLPVFSLFSFLPFFPLHSLSEYLWPSISSSQSGQLTTITRLTFNNHTDQQLLWFSSQLHKNQKEDVDIWANIWKTENPTATVEHLTLEPQALISCFNNLHSSFSFGARQQDLLPPRSYKLVFSVHVAGWSGGQGSF